MKGYRMNGQRQAKIWDKAGNYWKKRGDAVGVDLVGFLAAKGLNPKKIKRGDELLPAAKKLSGIFAEFAEIVRAEENNLMNLVR